MFGYKYKRLDREKPLIQHKGIFRREMGLFEATALIVSLTIGAGVLGIPYVVAKIGLLLGLAYVVVLGLLMMTLNLLIGEVVARTGEKLQLVGLAKKYLGKVGGYIMTVLVYITCFGILLVYIIGVGKTLATLLGGQAFWWSALFIIVGAVLIAIGLRIIKKVELFLSLGLLLVVLIIASFSAPHVKFPNIIYSNLAYLLLPYGVILFAFASSNAIPEAHALLKNRDLLFKKAIILAGVIVMLTYALFAFVVVGVTGAETTEIATIGLGNRVGQSMFLFGNIFALLAMGTSFLIIGLSLKDSLSWDYKLPRWLSSSLVCGIPFIIFLLGLRHFIVVVDIIGGVFISLELLVLVIIYWRAKNLGLLKSSKYKLHHTLFLVVLLVLALTVGAIYSVAKLF